MTDLLTPDRQSPPAAARLEHRTPSRRAVAVAAAGILLVVALVGEVRLHQTRDRVARTLDRETGALASTEADARRTRDLEDRARERTDRAELDTLAREQELADAQAVLALTSTDLDAARRALATTEQQVAASGARLGNLNSCLAGVQQALGHVARDDNASAIGSLRAVGGACQAALAAEGGDGPVFPFDFADPFVLRGPDAYYAYSTNAGAGNIQVIRSTDLRSWEWIGNALPQLPAWAAPNRTWAPSVLARYGYYVAYYTVHHEESGRQCISHAVSTTPAGPFVDTSTGPLVCQLDRGGSIDPSPFVEPDGRARLLWKSESSARLWSAPLSIDGRSLVGAPVELARADRAWERGVVEGPAMVRAGGVYHLFYSGGDWSSRSYGIGYAACRTPAGPCVKAADPVLGSHGALAGPGGQELFGGPDGTLWMAYHAYTEPQVGYPASRTLRLSRVTFQSGRPVFTPAF